MKDLIEQLKESVEVINGPLAGMTFIVEDHTPVENAKVKVKYVAPNNGPRIYVEHNIRKNGFLKQDRAEDVRIAFSKLLPANILWTKENGYSGKISGDALEWDRNLGRFVPRAKAKRPILNKLVEVLNAKITKGDN